MKYPKIIINTEVNKILKSYPRLVKPLSPPIPNRNYPTKPNERTKSSIGLNIFIFFLIGIICLFLSFLSPFLGFIGFVSIGVSLFNIINYSKIKRDELVQYESYLRQLKEYKEKLNNVEDIFLSEQEYYKNVLLPKYEKELNNYTEQLNKHKNKNFIRGYRRDRLTKYFQLAKKPSSFNKVDKFTKGATEDFFLNFLYRKISEKIITNFTLNYSSKEKEFSYKPDFIIQVEELNLYIDIEIDEPYIGSNGKPIHYKGVDELRNTYFVDNRWIVVRFAEIQVVKFPEECCDLINNLIKSLKNGEYIDFKNVKNIVPNFEGWNKEESNRLAFNRFRNTYLPIELRENINNEKEFLESKFSDYSYYSPLGDKI